MNPAASVEAPDRVRLAPPFHHVGPLLGRVVLGESLQRAHELAVDKSRRERIEVRRDHRYPHVIEQRETFSHIAGQDEEPGFCVDRAPGPVSGAAQVARQHPLVPRTHWRA
jgi:hypothetical protein